MTIQLDFTPTAGVAKEIAVWEACREERTDRLQLEISAFLNTVNGMEVQKHLGRLQSAQKILDLGFGKGESSLYLASLGHNVHAVDPAPLFCERLHQLTQQFSLPITVYRGVAECIDQISESGFDVCLFNASLHHCDNPLLALSHCHSKLKKDGKIFLLNEPLLKRYHSKGWYQMMLEKFPEKVGHYGGNEHVYYGDEYLELLRRSGYDKIKYHLHVRLQHPRLVIQEDLVRQVNGKYCVKDAKILIKFLILLFLKRIARRRILSKLLVRFSLIPLSFEGYA